MQCDGYVRHVTTKQVSTRPLRKIAPADTIPRIPSSSPFESDLELRYFRIFCDHFASDIASPFTPTLWKQLIPQASELEPFLRDAMVAIGALSQSRVNFKPPASEGGIVTVRGTQLTEGHYYALKKYDKALHGLRTSTERGQLNLRHGLFACILIFCIETIQGRQGAACVFVKGGLSLYQKWRAEQFKHASLQTRFLLDDEMGKAFLSLDLQLLFFLDDRPLEVQEQLRTYALSPPYSLQGELRGS
jgi:hypothetical protein